MLVDMKMSSSKNLVHKLRSLGLWPMTQSVVDGLEAERAVEAARAGDAYVASLTRKRVAVFVAVAPATATAPPLAGVVGYEPSAAEGGSHDDAS